MEIFQAPDNALGHLLSHIMITYLAKFPCICIISSAQSSVDFDNTLRTMLNYANNIPFKSEINSTSTFPNFYLIMSQYNVDNRDDVKRSPKEDSSNADRFNHRDAGTGDILNFDKAVETGINFGCQSFIVSAGMALRFLDTYATVIYTAMHRFANNHFVFVPENDNEADTFAIMQIFRHPVILDVPNILIITATQASLAKGNSIPESLANERNSFDLITSQFVGRFNNTSTLLLDTFYGQNVTFKLNANLFPDKLSNLEQRIVRLALFNYKPYTVWEEVAPGLGNANAMYTDEEKTLLIDGTESLVLLEFCSKHNCTLEISLDEAGEWGEIYENSTGPGVLGAIASRRADVGISALYEWHHEYKFLDFSTPITRTGITCIAPRPQLLSGLYLPIMPFSWDLWLSVLASIIFGALTLYALNFLKIDNDNYNEEVHHLSAGSAIFNVGAIYLLQSSNIIIQRLPDMFVLGCILLIGLMIGNAYSGGLASIMTVPQYEPPIDNAHQLAERNMNWGATQDAWIYSILLATQPDIVKLLSLFHAIPSEELSSRTKTRNFAFSVERLPYGSFAIGEYITEDAVEYLQLMHHDIYYEYALAMTRKTWMLTPSLDELILDIVQSGIQKAWEYQVVMKYSDSKVQLGVSQSRSRHHGGGPVSLSPSRLVGAFIIWGIGMTVSLAAFVVEICYKKKSTRKPHNVQS